MKQIAFTKPRCAELLDLPAPAGPLPPDQLRARSVVSLVSPGTELNLGYLAEEFPQYPGYANIGSITEIGAEVQGLVPGDNVLVSGSHAEYIQAPAASVMKLPEALAPEKAAFARLMGVGMSTLNTTAAHPPSRVLVTGLGPVGNLAAQVFARCGYRVTAVDPVEARRDIAGSSGIADVRARVGDDLAGNIELHVECSGHEQAVLDGCRCVRKRGEVVLLGVPWTRRTDIPAFEVLHAVFHRYVVLRSGWEWEVLFAPTDFQLHDIRRNYSAALDWLAEGSISVDGLADTYPPAAANCVYEGLLNQSLPTPAALFDWRTP